MKRKPDPAHAATDKELAALENRIAAEYRKAAEELQEKIDDYFERFKKRDAEQKKLIGTIVNGREYTEQDYKQWRLAQIGRGKRFEALRDRVAERMTKANEVAAAYINDKTPGIYSLNRNYAAYTIEQQVGADVGFDLWDEQAVKRLIVEQPDLMPYYPPKRAVKQGIDLAWGKRQITAQVTTGVLMGESIDNIANRLQKSIPDMNRTSAIRAARTAVTGAQNGGRYDSFRAAKKMGIELKAQWMATLDNRTRHSHAMLDGQTREIDEPFEVDGMKIMFPGCPTVGSKMVVGSLIYNCRCTLVASRDGEGFKGVPRRAKDPITGKDEIIDGMTYQEWYAAKEKQHGKEAVETARKKVERESADKKQFEEYKTVLGKNTPKTFAQFQNLKYNDSELYGFLKLDYARRNKLINHPEMALPGVSSAKIPSEKFTGYLFNPENKGGCAKGVAFTHRLGYSEENWKLLQSEILRGAKRYIAVPKLEDEYGQRYEQRMVLYGTMGRPANVIVGWIKKPNGTTSMTSAYIKEVQS